MQTTGCHHIEQYRPRGALRVQPISQISGPADSTDPPKETGCQRASLRGSVAQCLSEQMLATPLAAVALTRAQRRCQGSSRRPCINRFRVSASASGAESIAWKGARPPKSSLPLLPDGQSSNLPLLHPARYSCRSSARLQSHIIASSQGRRITIISTGFLSPSCSRPYSVSCSSRRLAARTPIHDHGRNLQLS